MIEIVMRLLKVSIIIRTTNLTLLFWTIRKTIVVKVINCELYADDGRLKLLKMCSTGDFLALSD